MGTLLTLIRYFCVVKPGRYRVLFAKKKNLITIVMCWCLAFVGSLPLFSTFERIEGDFSFIQVRQYA